MSRSHGPVLMTPEDRVMLESMLEDGMFTTDRAAFCLDLLGTLRAADAAGDECAMRILHAMAYHGLQKELRRVATVDSGVFLDRRTGRALNVPRVGSIPARDATGEPTGERQLKLWLDMTKIEFIDWVRQQQRHAESIRLKVRGMVTILEAWEHYPDAQTAREVCILEGIDPDQFAFESG